MVFTDVVHPSILMFCKLIVFYIVLILLIGHKGNVVKYNLKAFSQNVLKHRISLFSSKSVVLNLWC